MIMMRDATSVGAVSASRRVVVVVVVVVISKTCACVHAACALKCGSACVFGQWAYDSGLVSVLCVGCSSVAQTLQYTLSVTSADSHSNTMLQRAYRVRPQIDARV
jgi:hypothetical protein